jgi:Leucine-rich repeat (LRR) protein
MKSPISSPEGWEAFGRLSKIGLIELQGNRITSVPPKAWDLLGQLQELKTLDLSNNQIADITL